jgi:hypothetical protein
MEANAALIAAAPELYEALEKCEEALALHLENDEEYPSAIYEARAALAKARGET